MPRAPREPSGQKNVVSLVLKICGPTSEKMRPNISNSDVSFGYAHAKSKYDITNGCISPSHWIFSVVAAFIPNEAITTKQDAVMEAPAKARHDFPVSTYLEKGVAQRNDCEAVS